jgi:hypothetical protein
MLKGFLMKQLLKSKLKHLPQDQQDKIIGALEKNPKLFENIAVKAQEKQKQGKDQTTAIMEAAREYEAELREAMK